MKQVSMVESNLRIILDLRKFLEKVLSDPTEKSKYIYHQKSFTRKRCLHFEVLVMLLLNTLKHSLSVDLNNFSDHFPSWSHCTKQAFSAQRSKLKPDFFAAWNSQLVDSFYQHNKGNLKLWRGMKLWAVDGSSLPLPDTDSVREAYGVSLGSKNKDSKNGSPVARICGLYDVLNEILIKGFLHPYSVSEEEVTLNLFDNLDLTNSVLLFDRGYPSYWLMYQLIQKQTSFVMRASSNANNAVKNFRASPETDVIINFLPPYSSLKKLREMGVKIDKKASIKIRLVKVVLETGETEILMTNLYDIQEYKKHDFKKVYSLRWGIETYYGNVKEGLQLAQFSGIRPICIEQDFAANVFLSNLQSLIEKQSEPHIVAVSRKRKYRYKVNKNVSWNSLRYRIVVLFLNKNPINILIELEKYFSAHIEPIRPGRKYPRRRKRISNDKHYTFTNYKRAI